MNLDIFLDSGDDLLERDKNGDDGENQSSRKNIACGFRGIDIAIVESKSKQSAFRLRQDKYPWSWNRCHESSANVG